MKKCMTFLVAVAVLVTALPAPVRAAGAPLTDVAGHWAEADIRAAAGAGWVNGYPDGSFKPEGTVTRAEFLKLLAAVRSSGPGLAIPDQRLSFLYDRLSDTGHWSVTQMAVRSAMIQGIMEPSDYKIELDLLGRVGSWSFSPDAPITRLDAAVLITRALGGKYAAEAFWFHPGSQYSPAQPEPQLAFADSLPTWAKGWVASASGSGIIKGYPDGSFKGSQTVKRSEAVVMLRRLAARTPAPFQPLALLEAPRTPQMLSRDGLYYLDFTPTLTVRFDKGSTWAETAFAWSSLSRDSRARAVEEHARRYWSEAQANGYYPLRVRSVTVSVVGQTNQSLGEGHFDGVTYTYLDVNGNATPANPDTTTNLRNQLAVVPGFEDLNAQYTRYRANAGANYQGNPPAPVLTDSFPYQYLSDWFRADPQAVTAYARGRAEEFYKETKARLAAVGADVQHVTFRIAPSDTADRGGKYRSLLIGETLLNNPVLTMTYDGVAAKVVSRPTGLAEYVAGLAPRYEMLPTGEGAGVERVDPEPTAARRVMETFIYTLGMK